MERENFKFAFAAFVNILANFKLAVQFCIRCFIDGAELRLVCSFIRIPVSPTCSQLQFL